MDKVVLKKDLSLVTLEQMTERKMFQTLTMEAERSKKDHKSGLKAKEHRKEKSLTYI